MKAAAGDAEAQYDIACILFDGERVKKNKKEAAQWYLKAAKQGHILAQETMGWAYHDGWGVKENQEKAIHWYREAANQGSTVAQRELAELVSDEDPEDAASLYQLAAEAGDAQAQFKLAEFYERGKGIPKNDDEAFRWYLSAEQQAEADDVFLGLGANVSYEVGRCYATGQGVQKNSDEALKRLLPIADPKITEDPWLMSRAQIWVVTVFADPEHVKHDLVEAYAWLNLAAAYAPTGQEFFGIMSRESAAEFRDTLGIRLSKEQLNQAQLRSKELFIPRQKIDKRLGRKP